MWVQILFILLLLLIIFLPTIWYYSVYYIENAVYIIEDSVKSVASHSLVPVPSCKTAPLPSLNLQRYNFFDGMFQSFPLSNYGLVEGLNNMVMTTTQSSSKGKSYILHLDAPTKLNDYLRFSPSMNDTVDTLQMAYGQIVKNKEGFENGIINDDIIEGLSYSGTVIWNVNTQNNAIAEVNVPVGRNINNPEEIAAGFEYNYAPNYRYTYDLNYDNCFGMGSVEVMHNSAAIKIKHKQHARFNTNTVLNGGPDGTKNYYLNSDGTVYYGIVLDVYCYPITLTSPTINDGKVSATYTNNSRFPNYELLNYVNNILKPGNYFKPNLETSTIVDKNVGELIKVTENLYTISNLQPATTYQIVFVIRGTSEQPYSNYRNLNGTNIYWDPGNIYLYGKQFTTYVFLSDHVMPNNNQLLVNSSFNSNYPNVNTGVTVVFKDGLSTGKVNSISNIEEQSLILIQFKDMYVAPHLPYANSSYILNVPQSIAGNLKSGQAVIFNDGSNRTISRIITNVNGATTTYNIFFTVPKPTPTPTLTPSMTPSMTPTFTQSMTPTLTQSMTPSFTRTITPSLTRTITPSLTRTITPSLTHSITPSFTQSITPCPTPSNTLSITPSNSNTPTTSLSKAVTCLQKQTTSNDSSILYLYDCFGYRVLNTYFENGKTLVLQLDTDDTTVLSPGYYKLVI